MTFAQQTIHILKLHIYMIQCLTSPQPAEPGGPGVTTGLLQHTGAGPVQDLQARGGRRSRQGGFTVHVSMLVPMCHVLV